LINAEVAKSTRWFFPDINDRDAYTVCAHHLEKIRKAVESSLAQFP
jgi:hypothetical protein